jgi:hypothetical protein
MGDKVIEVNETYQYKIVNHDIVEKQMDDQKDLILRGQYQNLENPGKIKGN